MAKRIVLIQAHPSSGGGHFCHVLAEAYAQTAETAGHQIRSIAVSDLDSRSFGPRPNGMPTRFRLP